MSDFFNKTVPNFAKPMTSKVSVEEYFAYIFCIGLSAHLTHLAQPDKTLATHLALKDVYEAMPDFADSLVEKYQGIYGLLSITIPEAKAYPNPLAMIEEKYKWIQEYRGIFKESWIQNIIDQVADALATALYKLKFVK